MLCYVCYKFRIFFANKQIYWVEILRESRESRGEIGEIKGDMHRLLTRYMINLVTRK